MPRVLLWCAALVQSFAPRFDARRRCTVPQGAAPGADAAWAPHTRRKRYAGRYPRNFSDRYKEHSGDEATVKRVLGHMSQ